MKQYKLQIPNRIPLTCFTFACMLATLSCRKEAAPAPSDLDKNYFVVIDNPDDPVDHAIYEFYKSTGVASFYTDSIYKKPISKEDETPVRYSYVKLSFIYNPLGSVRGTYQPLSSTKNIPELLKLLQEEMIPKLPSSKMIPSIFFVDSFTDFHPIVNIQISHGWTSWHGFNTVGVQVKDVVAMSSGERKMYAASIVAGIAAKRINEIYASQLQKDFFSITRTASEYLPLEDIYFGNPYMFSLPPTIAVPVPHSIGLLFHPDYFIAGMTLLCAPRESDDIRAFLTAAFFYTNKEFSDLHPNETLVQEKFSVIRNIALEAGFRLPE